MQGQWLPPGTATPSIEFRKRVTLSFLPLAIDNGATHLARAEAGSGLRLRVARSQGVNFADDEPAGPTRKWRADRLLPGSALLVGRSLAQIRTRNSSLGW